MLLRVRKEVYSFAASDALYSRSRPVRYIADPRPLGLLIMIHTGAKQNVVLWSVHNAIKPMYVQELGFTRNTGSAFDVLRATNPQSASAPIITYYTRRQMTKVQKLTRLCGWCALHVLVL